MSMKPSWRSNSSATYWGAIQMPAIFAMRMLVVSSRPSCALSFGPPAMLAQAAAESAARKRRRSEVICVIGVPPSDTGPGFLLPALSDPAETEPQVDHHRGQTAIALASCLGRRTLPRQAAVRALRRWPQVAL